MPADAIGGLVQFNRDFAVTPAELVLRFARPAPRPALAFDHADLPFHAWREAARPKLAELLGVASPARCRVEPLRHAVRDGVRIEALRMAVDDDLTIPAYLLAPAGGVSEARAVLAIHGHGEVEAAIGLADDYHHRFALALARRGHLVLCPELRGFGALRDLALQREGHRLDYWAWGSHMAYSLVTDGFQHGATLLGETVEDLLRWEDWLAGERGIERLDVAGISYGGDLALAYPAFSGRVGRIAASGTLGSFAPIFARGYNVPAHCIPGVLHWLDRADIAGLNAPRPLLLHYGELDRPGPDNHSASFNETVPGAVAALRRIYAAAGAPDAVRLVVSPGLGHEMDLAAIAGFLEEGWP